MSVTLLIPCYNAGRFLPRLMEAVRAQVTPFERILAYDDGSDDDTVDVAKSLGLEVLGGNSNHGVSHARNRLADAATSEWIHFHDADDLISADYLSHMMPWCTAAHDVVSCDSDWIDENSRSILIRWRYDPGALESKPHEHLLSNPMGLNNSIIRKSSWDRIGGCDESLAMWEDADVHIRLARSGARFHHLAEVLTWALRRGESFSHDYRKSWRNRLQALEGYAVDPAARLVLHSIAAEAEKAAAELAVLGDRPAAEQAVALCRRTGGSPPRSRSLPLRLLTPFLSTVTLLKLQHHWRRRASSIRKY